MVDRPVADVMVRPEGRTSACRASRGGGTHGLEAFRPSSSLGRPGSARPRRVLRQGLVSAGVTSCAAATIIGLSVPFLSAIIAACGSDSGSSSEHRRRPPAAARHRSGHGRRHHQGGRAEAGQPARSRRHAGPRQLRHRRPVLRVPVHAGRERRHRPRPGGVVGARTTTAASGRSSCVKASSGRTARTSPRPTSPPRWTAWSRPGNSGLKGVIEKGAVDASDPDTAVFTLVGPNGNFPYLVSVFNAQTVITPVDYAIGHHARQEPERHRRRGSSTSYDPATGRQVRRNDDWWGGKTPLDGTEFQFFDDLGTMVTATQGGEVDAIVQFQVIGGDALFNDPNFNVLEFEAVDAPPDLDALRQGPVRRQGGAPGAGLHVRPPADGRDALQGQGRPRQRPRDRPVRTRSSTTVGPAADQGHRQGQAAAGRRRRHAASSATLHFGRPAGDPRAGPAHPERRQGGRHQPRARRSRACDTFYGAQWCPDEPADPPCSGAAELGIVDYGHRAVPDVYLNAALATKGIWNSSQYSSPEFDAAFKEYQAAVDVEAQTGGVQEDRDHPQRGRAGRPAVLLQLPVRLLEEVPGRAGVSTRPDVPRQGLAGLTHATVRAERGARRARPPHRSRRRAGR